MKLEHSFHVPVEVDEAWKILLDIERIGPCMPGASIDSVDGDDFTGSVKVKLGAINLTYKGKASFVEKDEAAHRAVIDARGRDSRGNGTAAAKVTAVLTDEGGGTKVVVDTDLDVTGKVAQFGRGVMVDVGNKLIGQFAECLASTITAGDSAHDAAGDSAHDAAGDSAEGEAAVSAADTAEIAAADTATEIATDTTAEIPTQTTVETAPPAGEVVDEQGLQAVAETPGYSAPTTGSAAPENAAEPAPAPTPAAAPAATSSATASVTSSAASSVNGHSAPPPQREVEPINLLEHAGPAVAKRLAPPVAGLGLLIAFILLRRRRG